MLSPRRLFFFEKWYFDAQCEDGSFVFLYFASLTLAGIRSGQFVISLVPARGEAALRSLSFKGRRIDIASDRSAVAIPHGHVGSIPSSPGGGRGVGIAPPAVHLDAGDVSVHLAYAPTDPPWVPSDGGTLLRLGERALTWRVPIPCARVDGEVRVGPQSARFSGFGYHDFVQTDIPPWRIPLRDLLWGRALGEGGALIWNRPLFRLDGADLPCARGWYRISDGPAVECDSIGFQLTALRRHDVTGEEFPDEMSFELRAAAGMESVARAQRVDLGGTRMFLGDNVADVTGFSNRAERWLYRKFTGNPVEYKLLSRVVSPGPFSGLLAAHERVLWGRGRAREPLRT